MARRAHPGIRCIGYLHSCLFPLQHAALRSLQADCNPDLLLTAGLVSKGQLDSGSLLPSAVVVAGSPRHRSIPQAAGNTVAGISCLVLPEGIDSECDLLFEFSIACALRCPEVKFVWRLHPLVSFRQLLGKNPKLRRLPRNVELSTASIDEDTSRCNVALYRGSTAILNAVTAGLLPVYLAVPGEISIDPLYELSAWKEVVDSVDGFTRAAAHVQDANREENIRNRHFAQRYCSEFYTPVDVDAVIKAAQQEQSSNNTMVN
jgi:hypothetical protein